MNLSDFIKMIEAEALKVEAKVQAQVEEKWNKFKQEILDKLAELEAKIK